MAILIKFHHRGKIMTSLQSAAQQKLRQIVETIERLEEDKAEVMQEIRDRFAEAKAMGFDTKVLRQVLKLRKKSRDERLEEESILATYMHALGMLNDEIEDTCD